MDKINCYSWKEHLTTIAKFSREMLKKAENIALRNLPILYTFILVHYVGPNVVQTSLRNTKLVNFAEPYISHFTTLHDKTLQFY